jgi:nitrite reductase/ring-hydroxylating ferredoxin subunit
VSESSIEKAFAEADESPRPRERKSSRRVFACKLNDLPPGERIIVPDGKQGVGLFNVKGELYAVKNRCPHAGAELCRGTLHGTHRPGVPHAFDPAFDGRILRCPWHGWEFDLASGKGLYDEKARVATYRVEVEDGNIYIFL